MSELECVYDQLNYDEACVELQSKNDNADTWLYSLSADCVACPYKKIARISDNENVAVKFNTARSMTWRVLENTDDEFVSAENASGTVCELSPNLEQYGTYKLTLENQNCAFETIIEPTNPYIDLAIAFGSIAGLLMIFATLRILWHLIRKKCMKRGEDEDQVTNKETKKRRVKSIDTFRGISILLMIFVNSGAGGYFILGHATWNGLLIGDLVYPCFLWIMGFCIPLALSSQLTRGASRGSIALSIIKRSILLFLIGLSLNTLFMGAELEKIRIFGVLQRISIGYFFVALIFLFSTSRNSKRMQTPLLREIQDVLMLLPQWILMAMIVAAHSILTFGLSIPDCPSGYLGPGGQHADGKYWNCTGGAAGYIDKLVLGTDHIFQRSTIIKVYSSGLFDPEGILGCLTTIFQVFLGVQAGEIFMYHKDWKGRIVRWLLWAVLLGCTGSALHFTNIIPINKNLWSLSFVLVTTAFALATLSVYFLLIDVTRIWGGGPFRIPGMNALFMYVGHQLCYKIFPFRWSYGEMNTHAWLLAENIWSTFLWTVVAYILHRKRTYITL